jgi:two-component system sensor histidine kinase CiaH
VKQIFESATLKLTLWYLAILMLICLFFSTIIYQISISEVRTRLDIAEQQFNISLLPSSKNSKSRSSHTEFQKQQLRAAEANLFVALLYSNLLILLIGGVGSYMLARRTLEPIEELHEAQTRFTSDASHELRTPLAIMKSELEVAKRTKDLTKQAMQELISSNLEEVNRLTELSDILLKLSRYEFSKVDIAPLNLVKVISTSIDSLHKSNSSRIKVKTPKKLILTGNSTSLVELCVILIDNAVKYSPKDSTIHISAQKTRNHIELSISNSGEGIEAIDLPHVFKRFYRADKSRSHNSSYGLGLPLAKKIVELHNGKIDIASKPGGVTVVRVLFKK